MLYSYLCLESNKKKKWGIWVLVHTALSWRQREVALQLHLCDEKVNKIYLCGSSGAFWAMGTMWVQHQDRILIHRWPTAEAEARPRQVEWSLPVHTRLGQKCLWLLLKIRDIIGLNDAKGLLCENHKTAYIKLPCTHPIPIPLSPILSG